MSYKIGEKYKIPCFENGIRSNYFIYGTCFQILNKGLRNMYLFRSDKNIVYTITE